MPARHLFLARNFIFLIKQFNMEKDKADKSIDASSLPQSETFKRKEVFQHKQPADTGSALISSDEKEHSSIAEEEKTSKEEGLNEQKSSGNAGAFEGFQDQGDRE